MAAANGDPVVLGNGTTVTENVATAPTVMNSTAAPTFGTHGDSSVGIQAQVTGNGVGLRAISVGGTAAERLERDGRGPDREEPRTGAGRSTGVIGHTGDGADLNATTDETGVYGFANDSGGAAGVWGDSLDGIGVVGTGDWGVYAIGTAGTVGQAPEFGTGV